MDNKEFMLCTFKEMDEFGNKKQCQNEVPISKIDKNNQNNNYCDPHQKFVYDINQKRIKENIKQFKYELVSYFKRLEKTGQTLTYKDIINIIENFNFVNTNQIFPDNKKKVAKPIFYKCDVKDCKKPAGDELGKHIGRIANGRDYQFCISHELTDYELNEKSWTQVVTERLQK